MLRRSFFSFKFLLKSSTMCKIILTNNPHKTMFQYCKEAHNKFGIELKLNESTVLVHFSNTQLRIHFDIHWFLYLIHFINHTHTLSISLHFPFFSCLIALIANLIFFFFLLLRNKFLFCECAKWSDNLRVQNMI